MNTKFLSALTATAAATALFSTAAPAHAFSFGTGGISFAKDTDVTFFFKRSYGAYQSDFGVYRVDGGKASFLQTLFSEVKSSDTGAGGNWEGTLGNTVLGSGFVKYTFLANQIYTLGLESVGLDGSNQGTVYSTSALNTGGSQQAVFGKPKELLPLVINPPDATEFGANPGDFSSGGSLFDKEGVAISFDDRGNGLDADFQDFTLTALAEVEAEAVPEPMTMTGLALGLGGLVAARRRRGSKTAS